MIGAERARREIRDAARSYAATLASSDPELVALELAVGRRLASAVEAREALPGFDNSAMDGFALRAEDTAFASVDRPVTLTRRGKQSAGLVRARSEAVVSGSCASVMTGAPLPDGADSVVAIEDVEVFDDEIRLRSPIVRGRHVRLYAEDVQPGAHLFDAGHRIRSVDLGVFSAQGIARVPVVARLKVGLFSTGDELVDAGAQTSPSQIRDASGPILRALLEEWGCRTRSYGFVADSEADLEAALVRAAYENDLVVFTGGVSMGEWDYGPALLAKLGAQIVFHKTDVKPGKPLLFATWNEKLVFGLPGNPVSSLVTFLAFVQEALDVWNPSARTWKTTAVAGSVFRKSKSTSQTVFVRVQRDPLFPDQVVALEQQGSHMISSLAQTVAFAELPAEVAAVALGHTVKIYPV